MDGVRYAVETRNVSPTGDGKWRTYEESGSKELMEAVFSSLASDHLGWNEARLVRRTSGSTRTIKKARPCQKRNG